MNIQPSVMVWTVICFLILTVILKKLLFTPVLEIIDSRREKIKAAAKKKEDIEKLVLEHKNQVEKETVETEILLVETVLLGNVPEMYIK